MRYKLNLSPKLDVSAPPITGAAVGATLQPVQFVAWLPSTWPATPIAVDERFVFTLKRIFEDWYLRNCKCIADATKCNGDLQHRGHVVAISLMCALDAISGYGYSGKNGTHIRDFISNHFPPDYKQHAADIYGFYRSALCIAGTYLKLPFTPDASRFRAPGERFRSAC